VCVTYGLGLMLIGVIVGKKIKILKHCVEHVCTFAAVDIYRLQRQLLGRVSDSWRATEARRAESTLRPEGPPRPEGPS